MQNSIRKQRWTTNLCSLELPCLGSENPPKAEAGTSKRLAGKLLACTCQLQEVKPRRNGASQDLFQTFQPQCTELFEIIIQPVGYVPSSTSYCVQVRTRAARNWYRQGTEPHCTTSSLYIAKQLSIKLTPRRYLATFLIQCEAYQVDRPLRRSSAASHSKMPP